MMYLYSCPRCGEYEVEQRITDARLDKCRRPSGNFAFPDKRGELACGRPLKRLINGIGAPPVLLSGASGGWSETGYALTPQQRKADHVLGERSVRRKGRK